LKKRAPLCFVYVLGCADRDGVRTYVGWTNDIAKRLARHNTGKGARSTRGRAWQLLYVEYFDSRAEAMRREYYLKRARKLRKQLSAGLSLFSRAP
jgi:putative endonuclease